MPLDLAASASILAKVGRRLRRRRCRRPEPIADPDRARARPPLEEKTSWNASRPPSRKPRSSAARRCPSRRSPPAAPPAPRPAAGRQPRGSAPGRAGRGRPGPSSPAFEPDPQLMAQQPHRHLRRRRPGACHLRHDAHQDPAGAAAERLDLARHHLADQRLRQDHRLPQPRLQPRRTSPTCARCWSISTCAARRSPGHIGLTQPQSMASVLQGTRPVGRELRALRREPGDRHQHHRHARRLRDPAQRRHRPGRRRASRRPSSPT